MKPNWGLIAAVVAGIAVLSKIASNPKVSPNIRFIARTAEGDLIQDLETDIIHLVPFWG
jgi:hypothetical protein